ncbi:hypothetical protein M8C21_033422 [Ambrosia artemisiifolia]|uniref:Uncharacterized protein n=1 Tax=Ambrosia artemisiifolia TaxID=4212 RepID=A0AAD5C173_AMBAR|nr:hypothetical protein M8C21_033422 [Ambrosia artemisiifolia]
MVNKVLVALWVNNPTSEPHPATAQRNQYAYIAGEAVTLAQDVVKTMIAKDNVLGKDALIKAKAFDESHQVSASAAAKVAELSERIGLTDKHFAGVEAV